MGSETPKLTKADTVALWYAVDAMGYQCRAMKGMVPPINMDTQKAEWDRLAAAKRALRKVNAIRKAASQADGAADEEHNGGER